MDALVTGYKSAMTTGYIEHYMDALVTGYVERYGRSGDRVCM